MTPRRWLVLLAFVTGSAAGTAGVGCNKCPHDPGYTGPLPTIGSFIAIDAFDERLIGALVQVEPDPEGSERDRLLRIQYTLDGEPFEVIYQW